MGQIKDLLEYIFNFIKIWIIVQPWEQGLIVRRGNKIRKVSKGMFFRIPYFDSVYIQESRLRMVQLCMQTLTTRDKQTVTINSSLGYSMVDIQKLFNTLCHPEGTISNIAMSVTSEYIFNHELINIIPKELEIEVLKKLNENDYGLKFEYFKITNFASVKTFRLIQDSQSWVDNSLHISEKR